MFYPFGMAVFIVLLTRDNMPNNVFMLNPLDRNILGNYQKCLMSSCLIFIHERCNAMK